jgi:hypothetical protein
MSKSNTLDTVNQSIRGTKPGKPAAKQATSTDFPTLVATMRGRIVTSRETIANASSMAQATFRAFPAQRAQIANLQSGLKKLNDRLSVLDAALADMGAMHAETDKRLTALESR